MHTYFLFLGMYVGAEHTSNDTNVKKSIHNRTPTKTGFVWAAKSVQNGGKFFFKAGNFRRVLSLAKFLRNKFKARGLSAIH
jgi:hypothetical protein